ncbi:hypothetical protein V5O39_12515 [Pseudomonas parakoreensis]
MTALLTARDVCQRLREAALGRLSLTHVDGPLTANHIWLDLEGWKLQVEFDGQRLHHCKQCRCPDGKEWVFGSSQFSVPTDQPVKYLGAGSNRSSFGDQCPINNTLTLYSFRWPSPLHFFLQ